MQHRQINTAENFFRNFSQMMFGERYRISTNGILSIKNSEGKSLTPYVDDDKSTTDRTEYSIGYGHQIKPGEEYLMAGITQQKAEDLLIDDLVRFTNVVNDSITVPLTQSQFDALVSYTFNIGAGAFASGNLVKLINAGATRDQIASWWKNHYITASGKPSTALQARRAKEFDMFDTSQPVVYTASLMPSNKVGKVLMFTLGGLLLLGAISQPRKSAA